MVDFLMISTREGKQRGVTDVYPKFIIKRSSDLMIRGGDFYAIWIEERGLWSTDEQDALRLIDDALDKYVEENINKIEGIPNIKYMWDAESGMIDKWHKYCQKQMRDYFHTLDEKIIFSNMETTKKDYSSKRLNYPLESGSINAYDKLMSVLYSEEERLKIEWAIGAIVSGESKTIQKFLVLYGSAGTGKSTVLNIIQKLFDGYYSVFDAKALGSSSNSFALEAFKSNPLVAIQHDGDLSRIEDNTRLNSLVSHELMTVNEKFKSTYSNRFKAFLFMGTNKPVKITDGKSGLIRRLIDVNPTGNKIDISEYNTIIKQIDFELGAIASHCRDVYLECPDRYDNYIPMSMLGASNDFYNFMLDSFYIFKRDDGVSLKLAWEMYKTYCDEAKISYPYPKRIFKEELKNYFWDYKERVNMDDGTRARSYYSKFRIDKFELDDAPKEEPKEHSWLTFNCTESIFDKECSECLAQYANENETPYKKWENVKSRLSSIDTSKIHYVKVPENHIVIDFDIPDENGDKSFEKNLKAANNFPPTYAELSKSGSGIHLHYIYDGDISMLNRVYGDHIEVKIFTGNSSLRRKVTKCNDLPIETINSGLPLKGEKKVVSSETIKSERSLRSMIYRNLQKEFHGATKPSVDFIYKLLEDAYDSGMHYDVEDLRNDIFTFAMHSTNRSDYCIDLVSKMKFKSEDISEGFSGDSPIVFFDIECFPNLFLVNWKYQGKGKAMNRMINPKPREIEELIKYRLIGFNCRRYDNHMLYACMMGYSNEELYNLSQKIISSSKGNRNVFFGEAYNISYTDVYDFASAGNKKSLKKFEIELGIHHKELGLPWDKPVPEDKWVMVAEYCDNDVYATEAVFEYLKSDWTARQILADIAGMTPNDTTNSLSTRIVFGKNRHPQDQFNYRNLAEPVTEFDFDSLEFLESENILSTRFDEYSILPYFPGYEFKNGKSLYKGEEPSEGGYVYSEMGMHGNVALLDIESMHPSSVEAEVLFGPEYTARFREIKSARLCIKHERFDEAKTLLNGALAKYLDSDEYSPDDLSNALKTVINSIYGLTSAHFDNAFRDPRNIDNIVAKRGALFMIDLKEAVQAKGFRVAHIKTDSIKIPDATPEIIDFVMQFGKRYGYNFEHEATYEKMCLVNKSVYIAKYATVEDCENMYGYAPKKNKKNPGGWDATGEQFAVPYVFKKLFSREPIEFYDMCEVKNVTTALYLDMNEDLEDVSEYEKEVKKIDTNLKRGKYIKDYEIEAAVARKHELEELIEKGHKYVFVGKIGQFCPIKEGKGGGILLRENNGKYNAADGTKGYKWLESEVVKSLGKEEDIDTSYYDKLVNDAAENISMYGDVEWFVSDDKYVGVPYEDGKPIYPEEVPFD